VRPLSWTILHVHQDFIAHMQDLSCHVHREVSAQIFRPSLSHVFQGLTAHKDPPYICLAQLDSSARALHICWNAQLVIIAQVGPFFLPHAALVLVVQATAKRECKNVLQASLAPGLKVCLAHANIFAHRDLQSQKFVNQKMKYFRKYLLWKVACLIATQ